MPFIYTEEPTFYVPRRNYHWVSDYDFLYEKLRHLEQRITALEQAQTSKEGTDEPVRDNNI